LTDIFAGATLIELTGGEALFLYQPLAWYDILMWLAVFGGLVLLNELGRANKWTGIAMFIVLPIVLTVFVWPTTTAAEGSSVNDWFHWAKVYSALAGCIGFMAIRFVPKLQKSKVALCFPPLILSVNILEAVVRDFQISGYTSLQMVDGMNVLGGPWNVMNGIAGILNIVTITGWFGIRAGKGKSKDMLWPDQLWFWIVAYDLWNYAYTYNCIPEHSFYAGLALLLSCTIPAFLIKKGAWLQHRAQTLAIWCMFAMTCPSFIDSSRFAVKSSHNPAALLVVSGLALASNVAVLGYELARIAKTRRNPLKDELYADLSSYRKVLESDSGSPEEAQSLAAE
jgi:hypothetical protein